MANYATQYCQALSQQYPNVLHFGALFARKQEGDYRWANAHTIEVPSVSVTGRVDGSRTSFLERVQRHNNTWTALTLRNHRVWSDFLHPRDIVETNEVLSIQNITRVMNETQKFPEKDRYLLSTLYADWIALGRVPLTGTLTTQNILTYFDLMMEMATERNVPATGRILYITPPVNTILKGATAWYRQQNIQGTAPASVQRALTSIDSVTIEEVPSDNMWTVYDFTVGAVRGATAKKVQMFLCHPTCVITPEVYDFAQLDAPSAGSQGKYEYFEESFEDAFILPNKQYGCDFFIADEEAAAATFTSAAYAGTGAVVGDCNITMTAPTGTNIKPGSRYFYAAASGTAPTALNFGEIAADNADWTEWDGKNTTVLNITNGYKATILVTDVDGRVYAAGNGTITSKAS